MLEHIEASEDCRRLANSNNACARLWVGVNCKTDEWNVYTEVVVVTEEKSLL